MQEIEIKRLLDETMTAHQLGVSRRTLQRWRHDGGGPGFVRLGPRRVGYTTLELDRWIAARSFAHHAAELAPRVAGPQAGH